MVHSYSLSLLCGQGITNRCIEDLRLALYYLYKRLIKMDRQLEETVNGNRMVFTI